MPDAVEWHLEHFTIKSSNEIRNEINEYKDEAENKYTELNSKINLFPSSAKKFGPLTKLFQVQDSGSAEFDEYNNVLLKYNHEADKYIGFKFNEGKYYADSFDKIIIGIRNESSVDILNTGLWLNTFADWGPNNISSWINIPLLSAGETKLYALSLSDYPNLANGTDKLSYGFRDMGKENVGKDITIQIPS